MSGRQLDIHWLRFGQPVVVLALILTCLGHCQGHGSFLNVSLFSPVFRLDEAIGKAVDLVREVLTEQNIEGQCLTEIEMSFFIWRSIVKKYGIRVVDVAQVWLLQSWGSAVVEHATEDLLPLWRLVLSRNQLIYHCHCLCNLHCM